MMRLIRKEKHSYYSQRTVFSDFLVEFRNLHKILKGMFNATTINKGKVDLDFAKSFR